MSKENLSAFYQAFRTDPTLQQQLDGITDPSEYVNKAMNSVIWNYKLWLVRMVRA